MFDKFSRALALMREAFEDAQAGVGSLPCVDLAAEVDGAQQVINAGCAVQALRVAQYAARVSEQDACGQWVEVDQPLGQVGEFAADCFGPMLAMGPVAAGRKVETAAALASRLPLTLAAMSAGDLDWWRASIIATELGEASGESCAAVEALIFPAVLSETAGKIRASTAAHDSPLASPSSVAMMLAPHQSRSPALIAARVSGSRDANAAAVSTLRPAATGPIASIGPKQS